MPTRTHQLATMFETIIHTYYGQSGDSTVTVESTATEPLENMDEYVQIDTAEMGIDEYIDMAVDKKRGCERASLMHYVAHGFKLLNTLHNTSKPLELMVIEHIIQDLTQLMTHLQCLLIMPKTSQISLKYDEKEVVIHGCSGCRSGVIVQKVMLLPLHHISGHVCEYITDIVHAHQLVLLAQENKQLKTDMTLFNLQLQRMEGENKRLHEEASFYSQVMLKQLNEIETMRNQLIGSHKERCRDQASAALSPPLPGISSSNRSSIFPSISALLHDPSQVRNRDETSPLRSKELENMLRFYG